MEKRAREGGDAEALRGVGGIVELVQNRSVRLSLELPRTRSVRISRIFDKVGSSRVVKTHHATKKPRSAVFVLWCLGPGSNW